MVEVVNIVAGGDLGCELDLTELISHFEYDDDVNAKYDSSSSTSLMLRFGSSEPLCMVYRTGKFVITGAESDEALENSFNLLLQKFSELDMLEDDVAELEIYNKVFTEDIGKDINLSKFAIFVGLEDAEYEPEQSPFLTYRLPDTEGVVTIASSGKMVINGVRTRSQAEKVVEKVFGKINQFVSS